jgi:hypothetical protein
VEHPDCAGNFNLNFKHWAVMRSWCEDQGWRIREDFVANSSFDEPWYFADKQKQMWFALRWS